MSSSGEVATPYLPAGLGRVWWIRPDEFCHLARSRRYGDSSSGRRRRAVRRHRRLADRHSTAACGAPQPGTREGGQGGARAHGAVARWALDTARRADPSVAVGSQLVELCAAPGSPAQLELDDTAGGYESRLDQRRQDRDNCLMVHAGEGVGISQVGGAGGAQQDGRIGIGGAWRTVRGGPVGEGRPMTLSSSYGQVLRHPSGQPAAARDHPGRRHRAFRRGDRLPDGLLLRARVPARQQGRHREDQVDPPPRRPAPPHAGVPGLRPARPVRACGQPGIPGYQGGNPRQLYLHSAGRRRRCRADCSTRGRRPLGCGSRATWRPRRCWPNSASRSSRPPCCCPAKTNP